MTRVFDKEGAFDATIAKFMTINPVVARSNEPIHRVLARMYNGGMRHLPVLDIEDRPVGTISVKSVVHFLAEYHPTTVYNLPPVPDHFASRRDGG